MALTEPRPKNNCKLKPSPPLPIIQTSNGTHRFKGTFNDFCVVIEDETEMKNLIAMGYFGKATLSRNYPQFQQHNPEIVRNRIFQNRQAWGDRLKNSPRKIIVVPDSDSEDEAYFTNLKPQYQMDRSGIKETVHLSLEESFFLSSAIDCLDIYHGSKLGVPETWDLFVQADKYFVQNYIVYYHFRSKNWVVKTGIKFGGDFLLYKQGPPFYHASYVVIINVVDEALTRIENLNRRSMKVVHLMGLNRLCETAGKELLICEIIWPGQIDKVSFDDLPKFSIKETIMKRWIPSADKQTDQQ